ncbi:bestrophin family protein [Klebsiella aerogenes]|uniref:bestrophin family protein n=1 Tax=Klebsiella aerogenes TaxID=548 RepID=UPI0027EDC00D|nr:bestrophin family ion channel [Klebsiella aerogenes]ELA2596465.1 ibestrophin [Klebsiella aerogenes]MDT4323476.1 bestrophin family ion channel [Klebsiella aerogenes]
MIVRPPQHWFIRLFTWHGSVLSSIIFRLSLNVGMSIIAIVLFQWYEQLGIHLTVAPFSLLGIAIAIFLGFRNNATYSRFVEARALWGTMIIAQRNIMRLIINLLPDEKEIHNTISDYLIAFSWSLKNQLRNNDASYEVYRILPKSLFLTVMNSAYPTNKILLLLGNEIGKLQKQGLISDINFSLINNSINELAHVQGGCERIANTPVPFAYTLILQRTVYLFCTLLPFALVTDLRYMTPFVSVFISYAFLAWDALAEQLEKPFGTESNDLPLNAICNTIERNLMDMTRQKPLPPIHQPDIHYNLT